MKYSKESIILLPLLKGDYKINNNFKSVKFVKLKDIYYLEITKTTNNLKSTNKIRIDNQYDNTVNLFIKGKYSEISDPHKQKILKYWNANKDSVLFNVFYPKEYQYECYGLLTVKAELWTKPQVDFL